MKILKDKIKERLETLTGSFGEVIILNNTNETFDNPVRQLPNVYISPFSIKANGMIDNCTYSRTYKTVLTVLHRADNSTYYDVEELTEDILNLFDKEIQLDGLCVFGINPTSSEPVPFEVKGQKVIVNDITVEFNVEYSTC